MKVVYRQGENKEHEKEDSRVRRFLGDGRDKQDRVCGVGYWVNIFLNEWKNNNAKCSRQ